MPDIKGRVLPARHDAAAAGGYASSGAPQASRGFVVLPKRWIVERTLAWLTRCRRLARNLENLARTSVALIRLAMIKLMARRLARS